MLKLNKKVSFSFILQAIFSIVLFSCGNNSTPTSINSNYFLSSADTSVSLSSGSIIKIEFGQRVLVTDGELIIEFVDIWEHNTDNSTVLIYTDYISGGTDEEILLSTNLPPSSFTLTNGINFQITLLDLYWDSDHYEILIEFNRYTVCGGA